MPKASVKRLIECKKKDLINLVLDIEKYPQFVPFCYDAKIIPQKMILRTRAYESGSGNFFYHFEDEKNVVILQTWLKF